MNKWLVGLVVILPFVWMQKAVAGAREDEFLRALQDTLAKLGNPWIAGRTSVSHLPIEKKRKLMQTFLPIDNNMPRKIKSSSITPEITKHLKTPPSEFDWRNYNGHNWMTPVKDQRPCGSCWAFAWVSAQEARINIFHNDPNKDPDLSEQFVISCNPYGYGCHGGRFNLGDWVMQYGIPDEGCFRYGARDLSCGNRCSDWESRAEPYKITDWGECGDTPTNIKNETMNGPLAVAIHVKEDFFYYLGGTYVPIMGDNLTADGSPKLNHGVCLAGWNDGTRKWLIKSSLGTGWGEGGYGWIRYGGEGGSQGPSWCTWMNPLTTPTILLVGVEIDTPNDGVWDIGEQGNIVVTLKSIGGDFVNVHGTLTTTDPNVTVDVDSYNFGNISQGNQANNASYPFKVTATGGVSPREVPFNLRVTATSPSYSSELTFTADIGWIVCNKIDAFSNPIDFPYGATFDGTYLWISGVGSNATHILKIDATTYNIVDSIPTPENDTAITGLACDGTYLWAHSVTNKKIYKLEMSSGAIDTSFATPASTYPTGLAYGGGYLWAVDRDRNKIFKVDPSTGNVVDSFTIPITTTYGPHGLYWEPHGPAGGGPGSLIQYITFWTQSGSNWMFDSTCIYEITTDGALTGKRCKTNALANGRLVTGNPEKGVYWVDGGKNGPIQKIRGFYPPSGVEEDMPTRWITNLTILPNPTLNKIEISFYIPHQSKVSISIYDLTGRLVSRLTDKQFRAGHHKLTWEGRGLPSSVYFCRIATSEFTTVRKFILLR